VDNTQAACGTCHGLPPSGSYPGFPEGTFRHQIGNHPNYPCSTCHPDVNSSQAITKPSQHIDGKVDLTTTASNCACH